MKKFVFSNVTSSLPATLSSYKTLHNFFGGFGSNITDDYYSKTTSGRISIFCERNHQFDFLENLKKLKKWGGRVEWNGSLFQLLCLRTEQPPGHKHF